MFNFIIFALTLLCINSYSMELVPRAKSDSTLPSMILDTQKEQRDSSEFAQTTAMSVKTRFYDTELFCGATAIGGAFLFTAGVIRLIKGMHTFSHLSDIFNSHEMCASPIPVEIIEAYAQCINEEAIPLLLSGTLFCVPCGVKKCIECCKDEKED